MGLVPLTPFFILEYYFKKQTNKKTTLLLKLMKDRRLFLALCEITWAISSGWVSVVRVSRLKLRPSLLLTSGQSVWGRLHPPEPAPWWTLWPGLSPPGCGEEDTVCPARAKAGREKNSRREEREQEREGRKKCGSRSRDRKETKAALGLVNT